MGSDPQPPGPAELLCVSPALGWTFADAGVKWFEFFLRGFCRISPVGCVGPLLVLLPGENRETSERGSDPPKAMVGPSLFWRTFPEIRPKRGFGFPGDIQGSLFHLISQLKSYLVCMISIGKFLFLFF